MNAIGAGLPALPAAPAYSPLGKPVVGLESQDTKNQTLPPVEESARTDKASNQATGQKAQAVSDDAGRGKGGKDGEPTQQLSDDELNKIRELAPIDREGRIHEAAHLAVGGSLAGAPSFRFITGPDGQQYAVGGEVPISLQVADDPQVTLRNAAQVHAAALAPAKPSAQDLQVAAAATQLMAEAQLQIAAQRVAALTANTGKQPDGSEAAGAFKQAAGNEVTPGTLLDQRI